MKYQAPYGSPGGPNDWAAVYINGNPSTGTMGSIPPAASIENPQREIVNFETDSGLTPADTDLHQLSKSVQNGLVNYCLDQGTPNFIAITPTPAVAAYLLGQHFRVKMMNANTGPAKVNVSGIGWAPLVHGDKTPMGAGELVANQMIDIAFDGSNWQMMTGGTGGLIRMTAPQWFYIDATIGSDTLYDGTQSTINGTHGPFLTLAHAFSVLTKFDQSGYTVTIQCADGSYITTDVVKAPIPNGSGSVMIAGNPGNPFAVKFVNAVAGSVLSFSAGSYYINGIYFQATAPNGPDAGICVSVGANASVWLYAVAFGQCPAYQIYCTGSIAISGPVFIYGSAAAHMFADSGKIACFYAPYPDLYIQNAVTFSNAFAVAFDNAAISVGYHGINYSGAVTGAKYNAYGNGVINTNGRGASYLPGSIAGSTSSGGQYL